MEKVTALLIGGPYDGLRRNVFRGQDYLVFAALPEPGPVLITDRDQTPKAITEQSVVYKRYPFSSDRGLQVDLYVHGDADPLLTLLSGYRQYSGPEVAR